MGFLKSTNISPCVLEQKDIASYIPYGLKVQDRDLDICLLSQLGNVDPCMDGDVGLCCDGGDCQQYDYLSDIKPILISDADCIKEGLEWDHKARMFYVSLGITNTLREWLGGTPREAFASLTDMISGSGTWESNLFVTAYEFELVK